MQRTAEQCTGFQRHLLTKLAATELRVSFTAERLLKLAIYREEIRIIMEAKKEAVLAAINSSYTSKLPTTLAAVRGSSYV